MSFRPAGMLAGLLLLLLLAAAVGAFGTNDDGMEPTDLKSFGSMADLKAYRKRLERQRERERNAETLTPKKLSAEEIEELMRLRPPQPADAAEGASEEAPPAGAAIDGASLRGAARRAAHEEPAEGLRPRRPQAPPDEL